MHTIEYQYFDDIFVKWLYTFDLAVAEANKSAKYPIYILDISNVGLVRARL